MLFLKYDNLNLFGTSVGIIKLLDMLLLDGACCVH